MLPGTASGSCAYKHMIDRSSVLILWSGCIAALCREVSSWELI